MTTIHYNGSKWAGQEPERIEYLLALLQAEPLDPRFEPYGNFIDHDNGMTFFGGNFLLLASSFSIETDDSSVAERLTTAIRANQQRDDYRNAAREKLSEWADDLAYTRKVLRSPRDEQQRTAFVEMERDYLAAITRHSA